MELVAEWTAYPAGDATVPAYMVRPAAAQGPMPAIVVIQEIWGVDPHIRDLCERFAAAGYVALAPDLYAHGGRRPEALAAARVEEVKAFLDRLPPSAWMKPEDRDAALARLPEPERTRVTGTFGALFSPAREMDRFLADLVAATAFLRGRPECRDRRVGSTGYCMGGALSALLACADPELAAAVIYYGAPAPADRLPAIRCPLYGFYGGDDPRITDQVPGFAAALAGAGKEFAYQVYPGAPHAFFNDSRASYRVDAARDAWARTLGFFARHLAPSA